MFTNYLYIYICENKKIMKMKNKISLTIYLIICTTLTNAQTTVSTNTVQTSIPYLGTFDDFDVKFKRKDVFSGRLDIKNTSFGVNSYDSFSLQNTSTSPSVAQTTCIGINAGQYNYNGPFLATGPNGWGNTYVGSEAGRGIIASSGSFNSAHSNVCVGASSGQKLTSGNSNVFMGAGSGINNQTGGSNVFIGLGTGSTSTSASQNVFIGFQAGTDATGDSNIFIGQLAGMTPDPSPSSIIPGPSGKRNICLGYQAGRNLTSGDYNTLIGNVVFPASTSIAKTIILADGESDQRLYINSNGFTGIGLGNNIIPKSMLEVKGSAVTPSPSGLRLTNLPNTSAVVPNALGKVLSVNDKGDVILVEDKQATGGALSALCNTQNFVTKFSGVNNQITCSSIFDNGTSVGIGTSNGFEYTISGSNPLVSGTVKLDVAGVTRTAGFYITSDKKFKKDIKTIDNSLEKIMSLEGKTYNWRNDEFKDKNFSNELQYGLIAQEVQKIIPSLVLETEKGELAMNYVGLIPVLIEAMKEQQVQINELKSQISTNFKSQNQDLLQFSNTKIISVSPNPSSDLITVSLNIEEGVTTASLQVNDINGNLLSNLSLKERDTNIMKTLQKDNFGKGIYIVSLIVNGKNIDTKKIIFN